MSATLSINENRLFDTVWGWVDALLGPDTGFVFKGFQNLTATPPGSYVIISPGVKVRFEQGTRDYDPANGLALLGRHTQYAYQVDCYGPLGPDWADTISIAWRSLWSCDQLALVAGQPVTPLYADEPQQLNIVNGELQYEQRFTLKLVLQTNQVVAVPQDFFTDVTLDIQVPPADLLPESP